MSAAEELLARARNLATEAGVASGGSATTSTDTDTVVEVDNSELAKVCNELMVPPSIKARIEQANDRSKGHQGLVRACLEAGLDDEAVKRLVALHRPSRTKYGARLDAEVVRSINKARADMATKADEAVAGDTPVERIRSRLVRGADLSTLPPLTFLIDKMLQTPGTAVVYAPPKSYKTFFVIDLACHIATGRRWCGLAVQKAPVLYIVGEGAAGMVSRQQAWLDYHGVSDIDIYWYPTRMDLMKLETADALAQVARDLGVGLVVVDTVARSMGGGADESATKDMSTFVESLDVISEGAGCTVLAVHHSGKDKSAGMRGSSVLRGAVDAVFVLSGGDGRLRVELEDARSIPSGEVWNFSTEPVGDSLVLVAGGAVDLRQMSTKAAELLDVLAEIATPEGISASVWREAAEMPERSFYRARKLLLDRGSIRNVGTDKAPRYIVAVQP